MHSSKRAASPRLLFCFRKTLARSSSAATFFSSKSRRLVSSSSVCTHTPAVERCEQPDTCKGYHSCATLGCSAHIA